MNCLAAMTVTAATTVPAANATRNHSKVADREEHEDAAVRSLQRDVERHDQRTGDRAPAIIDRITRSGSAAANGIAPSEMNEAPSSQAARPFSVPAR